MVGDKNYYDLLDETLVTLTLLGDNEAFESLVIRYQKKVISSAYSITRDYHLSEDIMQSSFVTAWTKLNTLREPGKFGAWICNIAKNNAKNAAVKYREYIHLDSLENIEISSENAGDYDILHTAVDSLSDKLKSVIKLHYFSNASIDEISNQLNLPAGTVKRRLHDGREKIRKELGYMENNTKTTAKSVLEKIEKAKEIRIRWRARESKEGFEPEYNNLITEIEQLPDSEEKYYYMADVMQLGWWWISGKDNDEMIEKIKAAAEKGKNTEILGEIWKREAEKYSGDEKTEYILSTLIPRMEQANMTDALGWEWFWLGYEYYKKGDKEKGYAAYNKVLEVLPKHHVYYANAISALRLEKLAENAEENSLSAGATGEELFIDGGKLYFHKQPGYSKGKTFSNSFPAVFYHASRCDNTLYDSALKAGESIKSHDGHAELKFVSDNAEIETSCGKFDGCELWNTESPGFSSSVYYKRGIGIVYISIVRTGGQYGKSYCSLKKYNIAGGGGLIPFCEGNRWEYDSGFAPNSEIVYEIVSSTETEVIFAAHEFGVKTYSPDNWEDMILQIRREYWGNNDVLKDVSFQIERAKALADTKYKKAHTAVVTDVIKRIFEGDETYTPDGTIKGHWNFFQYHNVIFDGGKIRLEEDRNFAFEWKNGSGTGDMSYHLAVNYFMSIIAGATGCIWSDEWKPGAKMTMKGNDWFKPVTDITVEHLDVVEVAAGRFEDCLKVNLDITGNDGAGWNNFCKGRKEFYYAKGIGLIKGVHYFKDDTVIPNYELTVYEGTGDGYMPVKDGLFRRYEGQGMTGGYVGAAEYTFVEDDGGNLKVLENNIGYRQKPLSPDNYNSDDHIALADKVLPNEKPQEWDFDTAVKNLKSAKVKNTSERAGLFAANALEFIERCAGYYKNKWVFLPSGVYGGAIRKSVSDGRIIYEENSIYTVSPYMTWGSWYGARRCIGLKPFRFLEQLAGSLYSEKWVAGYSEKLKNDDGEVLLKVEDGGTITTKSGVFGNCIKVTFSLEKYTADEKYYLHNLHYSHCGTKIYWYAPNVGIVKHDCIWGKALTSSIELTEYKSCAANGEYMPIYAGNRWIYDEVTLPPKFVARKKYDLVSDNNNEFFMIEEQEMAFKGTEEEYGEFQKTREK